MSELVAVTSAVKAGYVDKALGVNGLQSVNDGVYLAGAARVDTAISASAAQTAALAGGLYNVWATVDCYVKVALVASDVTVANGYLVRANTTVPVVVPDLYKIGAIAGGAGTMSYHKVG